MRFYAHRKKQRFDVRTQHNTTQHMMVFHTVFKVCAFVVWVVGVWVLLRLSPAGGRYHVVSKCLRYEFESVTNRFPSQTNRADVISLVHIRMTIWMCVCVCVCTEHVSCSYVIKHDILCECVCVCVGSLQAGICWNMCICLASAQSTRESNKCDNTLFG